MKFTEIYFRAPLSRRDTNLYIKNYYLQSHCSAMVKDVCDKFV